MGSDLAAKFVRLEQALGLIRPGNRVYLGTGCAAPQSLLAGLERLQPGPPDLELVSFVTTSALPTAADTPAPATAIARSSSAATCVASRAAASWTTCRSRSSGCRSSS